jgi:ABC-type transporter Mla subunit MlaD
MQKRAGIARAMALDPSILFLDEPSSGLDPITSATLDATVRRLAESLGMTFVIVTHDLPSVFASLDRVILLDKKARGIIAEGDPRDLRDNSPDARVRAFLWDEEMSQKANYFKLGLFVIGAIVAGVVVLLVIGSGRWFERKITIETYFNESVQGLDIGSKIKFKGVVIGEVTKISFTYVQYQQDLPMLQRARYVLVESQIQPRLVGGRAAAGDLTDPANAKMEVERGLRIRLTPQGITGTSYLELDYVEPPPAVLPISWTPGNVYIPSAPSTVAQFVNAASEILDRLHKLDVEGTLANINKLLVTTNDRVAALDAKGLSDRASKAIDRATVTLDKASTTFERVDTTLAGIDAKKLTDEGNALLAELRQTNAELRKMIANPALQKLPEDAAAAVAKVKELVADPKLPATIVRLERSLGRLDRILGGGEQDLASTISNLRQITDNLRDLTEDAKRYPSNLLFGEPPQPRRQP